MLPPAISCAIFAFSKSYGVSFYSLRIELGAILVGHVFFGANACAKSGIDF